jgi:hypothetical protein
VAADAFRAGLAALRVREALPGAVGAFAAEDCPIAPAVTQCPSSARHPGGPFTSGELVSGPEPDWSFVRDVREIEFQLLEPARSRTTWILYHEGKAYIPCGYMTTWWGRIWKQWPHEVEKDPRILLRIGAALYERRLVRIQEGPSVAPLLAELSRKYLDGREVPMQAVTSGYLWLYELAPRG